MGNELSKKEKDLVSLVQGNELGDLIKPMIREIHLFDSFVAGTTHLEDKSVLENVKVGDMLSMQREDNKFDSNAILILNADKKKLGYVPEKDNVVFARLMDAGKLLYAVVAEKHWENDWLRIEVDIYMTED